MNRTQSAEEIIPQPIFRSGSLSGSLSEYSNCKFISEINKDIEPCSSFFRCALRQKQLDYMENIWLPGIHDEIRNWKGFRHRLLIAPPVNAERNADDELEFVVILYFIGIQNLRSWSTSPEVHRLGPLMYFFLLMISCPYHIFSVTESYHYYTIDSEGILG